MTGQNDGIVAIAALADRHKVRGQFRQASEAYLQAAQAVSNVEGLEASVPYRLAAASALEDGEYYDAAYKVLDDTWPLVRPESALSAELALLKGVVLEQLGRSSEALREYRLSADTFLRCSKFEEGIIALANVVGLLVALGKRAVAEAEFRRAVRCARDEDVSDTVDPVLSSLERLLRNGTTG